MSKRDAWGEPVYVVTNASGDGEVYADTEQEAAEWAAENVSRGGEAYVLWGDELEGLVENPVEDPGEKAYEQTGLKEVCQALYGVDRLTADMVDSIPLLKAQQRIRPALPPAGKYDVGWDNLPTVIPSSDSGAFGMLAANAKLKKSETFDGSEAKCFGLSLAPHRSGLRPVGVPQKGGFAFFRDGGKLYVNTKRGKEYLFDVTSRDDENPLYDDGPPRADGKLGIKLFSGVEVRERTTTLCARATGGPFGCIANCLAHSGQNPASDEALMSKLALTAALYRDPAAFCKVLLETLRRYFAGGCTGDERLFVRLNVFSDIPWERLFPDLLDPFKKLALRQYDTQTKQFKDWRKRPVVGQGTFYDYTKVPERIAKYVEYELAPQYPDKKFEQLFGAATSYYWLTFSYSGSNQRDAENVLEEGGTVAVVFVRDEYVPAGDEFVSDGPPQVAISSKRLGLLATDYGFYDQPYLKSQVKAVWAYARDNSKSKRFLDTLAALDEHVPEYDTRSNRYAKAVDLISRLIGKPIVFEDIALPATSSGAMTLRKPHEKQWWYGFTFLDRPILNADANDLRGMDRELIMDPSVGRDAQIAKLRASGRLLGPVPPGTVVGLDYKPPGVKTETDLWEVVYRPPKKNAQQKTIASFIDSKSEAEAIAKQAEAEGMRGARIKKMGRITGRALDLTKSKFVTGVRKTPDGRFVAAQTPRSTKGGDL